MTAQSAEFSRYQLNSAEALEASLTRTLGALVGGASLTRSLGYPTQAAFRKALARNRVPIRVFSIEGRRGRFALVRDLAAWLHAQEAQASNSPISPIGRGHVGGVR